MPDDLRIPTPLPMEGRAPVSGSYRARAAREGVPLWKLGAAGLGVVLVLGVGGWATFLRRPSVVPVIEADTRPLRVKPDNPGGMQVAGADEAVLGDQAAGTERMSPVAEAPAPQALRAQIAQGTVAPVAAEAPAPVAPVVAVPTVTPPGLPGRGASPLPDTAMRMAAPAVTAPAGVAVPARAGGMVVQLAALDSEDGAKAEWQRMAKRMPELLGERKPVVVKAEKDGHAVWRVRTGGFADVADATGFCTKVKAKGGSCTIASF